MKNDPLRDEFKSYYGKCESPIESMLATAILYRLGLDMFERASGREAVLPLCEIKTQVPVGDYRIDIALLGPCVRVAIECDGHEFHEKTKEQAGRDKARDREIVAAGYAVLRFTGSEIWRNPLACAEEAVQIARQQVSEAAESAYLARRGN